MKTIFTALALSLVTSVSFAKTEIPEICYLQSDVEAEAIFKVQSIDVQEVESLNPGLLKLVNKYLTSYGYTKKNATLEEIQELFNHGEEEYNDLYLTILVSYRTGEKYIEVKSYPGDNAVGEVYNSKGQKMASNGDGDYVVHHQDGTETRCYDVLDR